MYLLRRLQYKCNKRNEFFERKYLFFFKGWLNFSLFKVLELLPTKARHECFEILKLYIKLYIV